MPHLVPSCDVRALPIGPQEAFLLSRIDGATTEADLAMLTGLPASSVQAAIDRLLLLGAISLDGVPPPAKAPVPPPAPPASPPPERAKSADGVDLGGDQRLKILDYFERLDSEDYYTLLGVAADADKKEIRRAYYAAAPDFHPDRFFGKKLGAFKSKMEIIFGRLTLAYETLGSKEGRAEYDAYLASQQQTRTMERLLLGSQPNLAAPALTPPTGTPAVAASSSARMPAASAVDIIGDGARPPHVPSPTPLPSSSSSPPGSIPPRTADEDRARREALARKLAGGRGSLPPGPSRVSTPPTSPGGIGSRAASEAAAQDLKRRHDVLVNEGRRSHVTRYVEAAKSALAQNNLAAAANAYRLAASLEPDNAEIVKAHEETSKLATSVLADGYLKQADYEARMNNWTAAAKSYVRAALGMPEDAAVLNKAAVALLKASGDLHQAADFAKRAVALTPKRAEPRLTLVELYLAANMPLLAKREWEAARELAPQDARMTELGKRLK
jgi:DnaJ domain